MRKDKRKYIIIYKDEYIDDIYAFANNITEAKQYIKECITDVGCNIDDVECFEILNKNVSIDYKINLDK